MRVSSRDLHVLVHSFSANDKMLFKRFNASAKKDAAYLVLFDALLSIKNYDEEKLQKRLKKKGVTVHLQSLKGYLYDQLMVFLRANIDAGNKAQKMRVQNTDADILLSRGLKRNALEIYEEQLQVSLTVANPLREMVALDNFIGFAQRTADPMLLQEYEIKLEEKTRSFLNKIEAQGAFRILGTFFADSYPIRDKQALDRLNKLCDVKIMRQEANMLSPLAYLFFYNFHTYLNYMRNDFERAYHFARKRYDYIAAHEKELVPVEAYRMSSMELLISCSIKTGKFNESVRHFNELKSLYSHRPDMRSQLLFHISFSSLNAVHEWKEATRKEREATLKFLEENKDFSPAIGSGMMNLAYACFRHKEYDHTLTLLNYVISDKYSFHQSVLQTEARMLGILTHYELKNYLLIEYLVTNTKRFLRQEKKLYPLENALMNGIRHLPEKINEKDMDAALRKLKSNLQEIMKNPFERNAMSGFDFVGWIEEKLSRESREHS